MRPQAAAPTLLACWLLGGALCGQEMLLEAPRIDALWADARGRVRAQCGLLVFPLDAGDAGRVLEAVRALPDGTVLHDTELLDGHWLKIGRTSFGDRQTIAPWSSPLAVLVGTYPLPVRMSFPGGRLAIPYSDEVHLKVPGEEPRRVPFVARRWVRAGYGLGDTFEVVESVPRVQWLGAGPEGEGLLAITDHAGVQCVPDQGAAWRLIESYRDQEEGILGIPHEVAPVVGDFDGDQQQDLVLADESAGAVALYMQLGQRVAEPERLILAGGPILAVAAVPDAEGFHELHVLRARVGGLLGNLQALTKGQVAFSWQRYGRKLGGRAGLARSPSVKEGALPLEVSSKNGVRSGRLGAQIWILGDRMLVLEDSGHLYSLPHGEGDAATLGSLPPGQAVDAVLVRAGAGASAVPYVLWRTEASDRIYRLPVR